MFLNQFYFILLTSQTSQNTVLFASSILQQVFEPINLFTIKSDQTFIWIQKIAPSYHTLNHKENQSLISSSFGQDPTNVDTWYTFMVSKTDPTNRG